MELFFFQNKTGEMEIGKRLNGIHKKENLWYCNDDEEKALHSYIRPACHHWINHRENIQIYINIGSWSTILHHDIGLEQEWARQIHMDRTFIKNIPLQVLFSNIIQSFIPIIRLIPSCLLQHSFYTFMSTLAMCQSHWQQPFCPS